jgi:tight adherence protein C
MNGILQFAIVLMGAVSAFLIAVSFVAARSSPMLERLARMQHVNERFQPRRAARMEELLAGESTASLRARLLGAGWHRITPSAYAVRVLGSVGIGLCIGLVCALMLPLPRPLALGALVLFPLLGLRAPKIALDRAIAARRKRVVRALPDFLDLLASTVQAGLALNAALIEAAHAAEGPLREELETVLAEVRLGRSRGDALRAMSERIDDQQVKTLVAALVQAEVLGSNVAEALRELAVDTRQRRWLRAEEIAAQLPVRMVLPMALLMMPALYVMIFGPALANVLRR